MNFKKFIYNLFFKKKKNSRKKSSQWNGGEVKPSTSERTRKKAEGKGKYDTSLLRQQVSETEYISNLRIGRSWILPQLIQMGFKKKGMSMKFDMDYFESAICRNYDISQAGRCEIWTLLKRNYKVIADSNGTSKRARWWTKDLFVEMMKWDFAMVGKRSAGLDRQECISILESVEGISDSQQIYDAIVRYDANRMRTRAIDSYRSPSHAIPLPQDFIDAYMGDGAYNAMMTMVKVLDIRFDDGNGKLLTRDECINEIEEKADRSTGRELLEFCKETFLDSGTFEFKKYIKK